MALAHGRDLQQLVQIQLLGVVGADVIRRLPDERPAPGGGGALQTDSGQPGQQRVQSKTYRHHTGGVALLQPGQDRVKFRQQGRGDRQRAEPPRNQQLLQRPHPGSVQMHPVMVPAGLPRRGAIALRCAAVEQQRLPLRQKYLGAVLFNQPRAPAGIE